MDLLNDPYDGFDPINQQNTDCGCTSVVYWDMTSQMWRKKKVVKQIEKADCSAVEAKLNQAERDKVAMLGAIEREKAKLVVIELENKSLKDRIAELEKQLASQPSPCEVLKANLVPVENLGGNVVYYSLREDFKCEGLTIAEVPNLADEVTHNAVIEAVRNAPPVRDNPQ